MTPSRPARAATRLQLDTRRVNVYKTIVLAYDGSEQAQRALDYTIELATLMKAEIGVVSVVPVHAGRIGMDPWDDITSRYSVSLCALPPPGEGGSGGTGGGGGAGGAGGG
jgi:hypothetical protein